MTSKPTQNDLQLNYITNNQRSVVDMEIMHYCTVSLNYMRDHK